MECRRQSSLLFHALVWQSRGAITSCNPWSHDGGISQLSAGRLKRVRLEAGGTWRFPTAGEPLTAKRPIRSSLCSRTIISQSSPKFQFPSDALTPWFEMSKNDTSHFPLGSFGADLRTTEPVPPYHDDVLLWSWRFRHWVRSGGHRLFHSVHTVYGGSY
ncbi:hypothetical protein ASPVEDRAFT_538422 [Aspergillus versicolor CBS 583.65]|uniref:Uncharacterized protein n=1 Tax=Aspergillus versicolor CBS 583.65 TaxID=1036611 RepID=A0A1L9PEQ5_ASPVE|nr:uncharacterized protein ASPVEDRAFT_538422 [Aspergillus versicolor CBS 583.65]OJI99979.1 hypothetical protein ASPVEDRAFT_538422 [Aspergillus versicolor CBS 583.65]